MQAKLVKGSSTIFFLSLFFLLVNHIHRNLTTGTPKNNKELAVAMLVG